MTKTATIERTCVQCGEAFDVDTSQCVWWSKKYCDENCRKVSQNKVRCQRAKAVKAGGFCRVKKCEWCNEPFVVNYEHRGQRFCSRPKTCAYDFQRGKSPSKNCALYEDTQGLYKMSESTRRKLGRTLLQGYRDGRPLTGGHRVGQKHFYVNAYTSIRMRSMSEVLFAHHLDNLELEWEYEPQRFDLGWTTYTPDFYLPNFEHWVEVKGFWTDQSLPKVCDFADRESIAVFMATPILRGDLPSLVEVVTPVAKKHLANVLSVFAEMEESRRKRRSRHGS